MNMLKSLTIAAGLITMLSISGSALANMITGTIDGKRTEFYQEDIWQIISDITPDTEADRELLSKSDKKFVRQLGSYQKKITRLQAKAEIRELNDKQTNRLLKREDRLVQLLDSRGFLDSLLLAGLVDDNDFVPDNQPNSGLSGPNSQEPPYATSVPEPSTNDFVPDNQPNSGFSGPNSQEPPYATSVPEPSTLALLALGLLFLGIARGKHTYRP